MRPGGRAPAPARLRRARSERGEVGHTRTVQGVPDLVAQLRQLPRARSRGGRGRLPLGLFDRHGVRHQEDGGEGGLDLQCRGGRVQSSPTEIRRRQRHRRLPRPRTMQSPKLHR